MSAQRWWLFELKTDMGSVRDEQLDIYLEALARPMSSLVADVRIIAESSPHRAKYGILIDRLEASGFPLDRHLALVYLAPNHAISDQDQRADVHSIAFADLLDVELTNRSAAWRLVRDQLITALVHATPQLLTSTSMARQETW